MTLPGDLLAITELEETRSFLRAAKIFFEEDADEPQFAQCLNLNDAYYAACADGEQVSDAELPRLAELYRRYGTAGVNYWVVVEKRKQSKVEFADVNRQLDFVRNEEAIRKEIPSSTARAYAKRSYTIGE